MAPGPLTPVSDTRPGDHLCFTFADELEQQVVLACFVDDGLTARDQVLWLTDADPAAVLERLRRHGVATGPAVSSGQLEVCTAESILGGGTLEPRQLAAVLLAEAAAARARGYRALRLTSDLAQALSRRHGVDGLLEYERGLAEAAATGKAIAICQYDRRHVAPEVLVSIHQAHSGGAGANPEFRDQLLCVTPTFRPFGLRLEGEVDMTNRAGLARALAAATRGDDGDVHLDLAALEFMHVDGLRLLIETASALPPGRYLVLDWVPAHLRRIISLVGWDQTPGLKLGGEPR